jgi:hypothetical protein
MDQTARLAPARWGMTAEVANAREARVLRDFGVGSIAAIVGAAFRGVRWPATDRPRVLGGDA